MMAYAQSTVDGFGNQDRRLYWQIDDDALMGPTLRIMSEDAETGGDDQLEVTVRHLSAEDAVTLAAAYSALAARLRDAEANGCEIRDNHGVQEPVATGGE